VCSLKDGAPACAGECRPKERRCGANQTPQHCDDTGTWIDEPTCAGECVDGACSGECRPGQTRCVAADAGTFTTPGQTCDATSHWGAVSTCTFVCSATAQDCDGVCTPGSKRCSGSVIETCGNDGFWKPGTNCGAVPCTGGECKPCTENATQCNAGAPQKCV